MSFASDLFSGLTGFRDHLVANAESAAGPVIAAVEGHLARLEPLVRSNVLGAEDEAKAILHELYTSVVGEVKTDVATPLPAAPAAPETSAATEPAPVEGPEGVPAPVAADPTPAPETTEASSAPSNATSEASSAATEPAAPAAPAQ